MPIYEYRCTKGHTFDIMQRFSDEALTKCQVCGAPAQRVMHAPAVHFKGSGFYNTDYGTKKRSREMKEAKEGVSKSESSSDSKTSSDSKASSSDSKSSSDSSSSASKSENSSDSGSSSKSSDSGSKAKASKAD
jgi:putative FmdB family regulatory protein